VRAEPSSAVVSEIDREKIAAGSSLTVKVAGAAVSSGPMIWTRTCSTADDR